MKKFLLGLGLLIGSCLLFPQQADAQTTTQLTNGIYRTTWTNADGSKIVSFHDANGNVIQFYMIDS